MKVQILRLILLGLVWLFFSCSSSEDSEQTTSSRGMITVTSKTPEGTERRIAFVIGNKDYQSLNALKNPLNDATDMTVALKSLGFKVITATNADYRSFTSAFNRFKDELSSSDVAFFYYSGHGVSYSGKNYLMPVDADISCLEQIEEYGFPLDRILTDISAKNVKNSFVILDACRNLPNLKVCNSSQRDLSNSTGLVKPTNNPRGSMIVYATEEGSTADDNTSGRNGLFTGALLEYLTQPNLGIRDILDKTTAKVESQSNGSQSPGRYDKMQGNFVFIQSMDAIPATTATTQAESNPIETSPNIAENGATELNPNKTDNPINAPINAPKISPSIAIPSMVKILGGTFQLGANSEGSKGVTTDVFDFEIGKYEVTVEEYMVFANETKSHYPDWYNWNSNKKYPESVYLENKPNLPIVGIDWEDAMAYCNWLSTKTGKKFRLPTDAEWEYAARGGQKSKGYKYAGGNTLDQVSWNQYNSGHNQSVGKKKSNELGLFDMSGNVAEWCFDTYKVTTTLVKPLGYSPNKIYKKVRGGEWQFLADYNAGIERVTKESKDYSSSHLGFRIASNR
jgi:formylglycine-generating enzyme required for sulfatase activity